MTCFRSICLPLLLASMGGVRGELASTSVEVFADNREIPLSGPGITVPYNTSSMRFSVKPGTPRLRYQLADLDTEWRERTGDMLFIIRFLNQKGDQISQVAFPAVGTSAGWNGSVENSVFTSRRETVTVPKGAVKFTVVISSAGPAELVGVFAVSGITIQGKGNDAKPASTYLRDSRLPNSQARIWGRSGTHPSMATALHFDADSAESPVFIIVDDDIKAHADWNTWITSMPTVNPGETLELQWREVYCSGLGGSFSTVYERLPAGRYEFKVEELSIMGVSINMRKLVTVTVPRPYWKSFWFWVSCVVVTAVLSTLYGRRLIRKRINLHLQQAQLISDERLRIARDLHDDLGTRLSHISLLSAFAQNSSPNQEVSSNFGQITAMSRELIGALSETVWMLNPKNNQLEALVDFLCRLVSELCRLAEIRCRIDAMSVTEDVSISHEFRHNVSLAVKEIVNNALKHSCATEITMNICVENKLLKVTVTDNGIGITRDPGKPGLGLESITQRMATIRGKCHIEPVEGDGLKVSLEAPIT